MEKKISKKTEDIKLKKVSPKKIKNKGKRKKKVLRVLVYMVLILFLLSLLFIIGYGVYYFCTSSKYNITKVEFKGNKKYTYEILNKQANVKLGTNLYRASSSEIENNLKQLPYIESVSISKKRPGNLIITVKEYVSKYVAYNIETSKYIRLTADGRILETIAPETKTENELLVFGINFDDNIKEKQYIVDLEKQKLELYTKVRSSYDKVKLDKKITNIEFKDKNLILTLDNDINVILNNEEMDYKITFLKSILNEIQGKAGNIDMTKENPIFTESIK